MKYLIIAAHPDDEVLGCGGTIARLINEGHEVSIAILSHGITSRYSDKKDAENQVHAIQENIRQAAEKLGVVKNLSIFDLPDNSFDSIPLLNVIRVVEEIIDNYQPECIFTHHGGDLNIDHQIVFRATLTATRSMKGIPTKKIYAYEIPSSTEWSFNRFFPQFSPNSFFNIESTLEIKLGAMRMYSSEIRDFPHPRSVEALEATARRWGSVCGFEAAEAFELIRDIY